MWKASERGRRRYNKAGRARAGWVQRDHCEARQLRGAVEGMLASGPSQQLAAGGLPMLQL